MTNDTKKAGSLIWLAALTAAAVAVGPGCKKASTAPSNDAGDAGEVVEAGPAPAVGEVLAAAIAVASNQADVTRYADERPTPGSTLTTESAAELRTEIGTGGKLVVIVKKGTEVSKLSERGGHYLVITEDPKDPTRKLLGWSSESAFGGGGGLHAGPAGAHTGDGGVEAGKAAAGDAGGGAAVDAGGGAASVVPGYSCVKQQGGKCPAPYVVSQALCRLPCKAASDCKGPDPKCNGGLCYASNGCGQ